MPLPIGHTAAGLVVFETMRPSAHRNSRLAQIVFIAVLANLPDLDVLLGLIVQGNGSAFHRGPSHSLLFALIVGFAASQMWRFWHRIPRIGFAACSLLIFSHVAADILLTSAPVSLFWPLEIHWSAGHNGWGQVINMVLFQSYRDAGIAFAAGLYLFALRFIRSNAFHHSVFAFARKRSK